MRRLSVIIPNFNYGEFVGQAITSALSVEWPDVEVIVVDDGSEDDSRDVIAAFGNRIEAIFQVNSGPRVACNVGYAASTGDVVIFLDSDDVLDPTIALEVAAVWRPSISKVQVQMRRMDRYGMTIGAPFPKFRSVPTPEQIRGWMIATTDYPTPPGSGNAYSRGFLEKLLPLDDRCGDATDSACLAAAPFLGDVVTLAKALVGYRVHGANRSDLMADPARFSRQIERAVQRQRFAVSLSPDIPRPDPIAPMFRSRHLLQMRIAEHRLNGGAPPIPGDSKVRMAADSVRTVFSPGPDPIAFRVLGAVWCAATLAAPALLAQRLIGLRFRQRVGPRRASATARVDRRAPP